MEKLDEKEAGVKTPATNGKPKNKRGYPTPPHSVHKDGRSALVPAWGDRRWAWVRVDLDALTQVLSYKWRIDKDGYPVTNVYDVQTKTSSMLYLHRMITRAPEGVLVDHRWRNKLDARRIALRFATHQENSVNRRRSRRKFLSRYRGVTLHKGTQKWQAQTKRDGKHVYGGLHNTEEQAACAYNVIAKREHGRFAVLNNVNCKKLAAVAKVARDLLLEHVA